jgi:hypothetical protein
MNANLVIAIPSGGSWSADFGMSLAMLMTHLMGTNLPLCSGQSIKVINTKGSLISRSRELLVEQAIEAKATHLFFVDSDQTFPRTVVHDLFKWQKMVVAANCPTKTIPTQPTARQKDPKLPYGTQVYTDPDKEGLEKVWRVGTGIMLVNMEVFKKVRAPRFEVKWLPKAGVYVGEDWYFCQKLEQAGFPIFIDHTVSKQIGHVGSFEYNHDLAGEIVNAQDEVRAAAQATGGALVRADVLHRGIRKHLPPHLSEGEQRAERGRRGQRDGEDNSALQGTGYTLGHVEIG